MAKSEVICLRPPQTTQLNEILFRLAFFFHCYSIFERLAQKWLIAVNLSDIYLNTIFEPPED